MPEPITKLKETFAGMILECGAIKFGAFKLKLHESSPDAPLSPLYIDLRLLRSYPAIMTIAVQVLEDSIQGLAFDLLADVPTAATPLVAILSYKTGVPMITPREAKSYGSMKRIDGAFKNGQTVLLIDDLITKAHSKLTAIQTLEQHGLQVRDIAVLIDREQGGIRTLREKGYQVHAAFPISQLLGFYKDQKIIKQQTYQEIRSYLEREVSSQQN